MSFRIYYRTTTNMKNYRGGRVQFLLHGEDNRYIGSLGCVSRRPTKKEWRSWLEHVDRILHEKGFDLEEQAQVKRKVTSIIEELKGNAKKTVRPNAPEGSLEQYFQYLVDQPGNRGKLSNPEINDLLYAAVKRIDRLEKYLQQEQQTPEDNDNRYGQEGGVDKIQKHLETYYRCCDLLDAFLSTDLEHRETPYAFMRFLLKIEYNVGYNLSLSDSNVVILKIPQQGKDYDLVHFYGSDKLFQLQMYDDFVLLRNNTELST